MTDEQRELREAYGYAVRFLHAFIDNNGLRQVKPLPTLCGVLTQIDNATTAPRARVTKLEAALKAAYHALESYAHDNASTELAVSIAAHCKAVLSETVET